MSIKQLAVRAKLLAGAEGKTMADLDDSAVPDAPPTTHDLDAEQDLKVLGLTLIALHSATVMHMAHFATSSFAQHKALDEYYTGIVEHVDKLVEVYQGAVGRNLPYPSAERYSNITVSIEPDDVILSVRTLASELERDIKITHVGNILQDMQAFCSSVLYKLTLS